MELRLFILVVFSIVAGLVTSNPLPEPRANPADVCSAVEVVVAILKLQRATPFCSSFISITTSTLSQTSTTTSLITITAVETQTTSPEVTSVISSTTTQTLTATETQVSPVTATEITVTTTRTNVEPRTATTTRVTSTTRTNTIVGTIFTTITPSPTTIYTDPPARRSAALLEERGPVIPLFLRAFASSAISSACSCLSLATPISTETITATDSATISEKTTTVLSIPVTILTTDLATATSQTTTSTTTTSTTSTTIGTFAETTTTTVLIATSVTTLTSLTSTSVTTTITVTASGQTVRLPYPTQVVQNPSFEIGTGPGGAPPWTGFFTGNPFSFLITSCDNTLCAFTGNRFVDFVADNPGGTTTIRQNLVGVKPGRQYLFSAYVGFYNGGVNNPIASSITVTLDGVTIIPTQLTCQSDAACQLKGSQYYGWRRITATVTPTSASPVLIISETLIVGTTNQIQDSLLDDVTLTLL